MIDLANIIRAVIALIATLITSFLIPWIKRKCDEEKLKNIQTWVSIAVYAAEQIFNGPGLGEEKKAYVLKFLCDHGYTVNADELDAMIEAAVLEMKNNIQL